VRGGRSAVPGAQVMGLLNPLQQEAPSPRVGEEQRVGVLCVRGKVGASKADKTQDRRCPALPAQTAPPAPPAKMVCSCTCMRTWAAGRP